MTASKPAATEKSPNPKLSAVNAATARLKAAHHDEFETLLVEECAARGITYTPPLTEEEKAHKQILDLISKHGLSVAPTADEVRALQEAAKAAEDSARQAAQHEVVEDPVPDIG